MSSPLFVLDGMISAHGSLVLDDVVDRVVVRSHGRLLVSMVDVLAIVRLDRGADVLLVEFVDGSSPAFRIADVLERDDVFIAAADRVSSRSPCVEQPAVVAGRRRLAGGGLDQGDDLCSVRRIAMTTLEAVWMTLDAGTSLAS